MRRVNVMVGRFQPLTNGHLKCIEEAWNMLGVPTVICMINTKDEKVDERKPFPSSLLKPMYEEFAKTEHIVSIELVTSADIVKIGTMLKEKGIEVCSWTCGTDRYDSYSKMAEKYHDQAYLSEDFKMIEVHRSDDDISATVVRDSIYKNSLETFLKMTPFDKSEFNILRNQLLNVINK